MTLDDLISQFPPDLLSGTSVDAAALHGVAIADVTEDSRAVNPGSLFVARRGECADGRRFSDAAVEAGAMAVLTHDDDESRAHVAELSVPVLFSTDVPRASAWAAELVAGRPSRTLNLIGVTGTNGKTTIAHLVRSLCRHARRRCGVIGTVEIDDGAAVEPASLTTPPSTEISRILQRMVNHGADDCVMEVSSHALAQSRVSALDFDVAIFSNLSGDHMDYHGTVAAYIAAKASLFTMLGADATAIVNADDSVHESMIAQCEAKILRCSLESSSDADCTAEVLSQTIRSTRAVFRGPWGALEVDLPLTGDHNVMNLLQATAAVFALGVSTADLGSGIGTCAPPPGRFEAVTGTRDPFTVLVDYAHTDDALENALGALKPLVPATGRLHVLFGCGGDRDRTKRPRMAEVACRLADVVHVTSDNPRTEDPGSIIDEILTGVPSHRHGDVHVDADRAVSIERMIRGAAPDDVLLIAGKGHEDYQIIGTEKRSFDDRVEARRVLRDLQAPEEAAHA